MPQLNEITAPYFSLIESYRQILLGVPDAFTDIKEQKMTWGGLRYDTVVIIMMGWSRPGKWNVQKDSYQLNA
ncbi:unnamed protein product [Haemonchus placei]|uniref:Peptidase M12A domain-containing protein n=1 Tax=Haemonchus placei TaxID=6290 RepID=A0A0N4X1M3_HAEPC|nr:unnamed protein product [Haemonchus placei]